jgi:RNA polymerase sigma factor (sigma-70 family)
LPWTRTSSGFCWLKRQITPEDIWQDTLLHVWRDRAKCEWRGVKAFRAWVLSVVENRIREQVQYCRAAKRGSGVSPVMFSTLEQSGVDCDGTNAFAGPAGSTTPSRVAIYREQAMAMQAAMNSLPEHLRAVVHLRLFEQLSIQDIADRLAISPSIVRHRFRDGAALYQSRLTSALATQTDSPIPKIPALGT